jgi:glutamyl/glutaminyl-tRNA synthetase
MSVRFAPSPTGEFHVGNLRTAWISHALARALNLPWVVRFEDIDRPRVVSGAQDRQLEDMAKLGLTPDRVLVQSAAYPRHQELFHRARDEGRVYPCTCSRREIQEYLRAIASAPHGPEAPVYDGRCRGGPLGTAAETVAWRFRDADDASGAHDFVIGRTRDPQAREFVPAYHWACAIDDHDGAHALLVRAWDLESALEPQRRIHSWVRESTGLRRPFPAVFHTSLVTQDDGHRLEKRTRGVTLGEWPGGAKDLVARFQRSWDSNCTQNFSSEKVWGEPERTLRLSTLA